MKIKTRLLLFLLPTVLTAMLFVAGFFYLHWRQEILESFQKRLKSSLISCASLLDPQKPTFLTPSAIEALDDLKNDIEIIDTNVLSVENFEEHTISVRKVGLPLRSPPEIFSINKELFPEKAFVTSIYASGEQKIITAYAPLKGNKRIFLTVNANAASVDQKIKEGLHIIFIGTLFSAFIMTFALLIIANRISRPVEKLKTSALAIAAGQYGNSIKVEGPREIVELANTLNTMSECLHENLNRFKENSLQREKSYSEYESSLLLQNQMLKKVLESCSSDYIASSSITILSENPKGLILDFPSFAPTIKIHLMAAKEKGFDGMYSLLTKYQLFKEKKKVTLPFLKLELDPLKHTINYSASLFPHPLIWSIEKSILIQPSKMRETAISAGDFIFIFNQGLINFLENQNQLKSLLTKVLKYFAEDGLDTCSNMIEKELSFDTKRKGLEDDIHLICFQLLY